MLRVRLLLKRDRFSAAEELLPVALRASGQHAIEGRETLVALLKLEGRFDELRTVVQEGWDSYPDRFGLLRQLANLDSIVPVPIEKIWPALEKAAENSPDDDRIWLGRANLAIRKGEFVRPGDGSTSACEDDRATHRSGRAGSTWPWQQAMWPGSGSLSNTFRPTASRRWCCSRCAPGSPHVLATTSASGRRLRICSKRCACPGPGRGATGRARVARRAARERREAARRKAELDRAKIHYEILVTKPSAEAVHESAQMRAPGRGAGPHVRSPRLWSVVLEKSPGEREAREALTRLERARAARAGLTLAGLLAEVDPSPGPESSTAAGTVDGACFTDDAEASGLRFAFDNGATPERQIPETMSGGVALIDYDGDGWLDVYLVQGGPFPPDSKVHRTGDRLFHNQGDGTFVDATEATGIAKLVQGYGHGVAVGDYDNDGRPDLFVTRWRSHSLYRNLGNGAFADVTEAAGLGGERGWPTSAAFADLDGDGDLDLYVCHYLEWDAEHPQICFDQEKKRNSYCASPAIPSLAGSPLPQRLRPVCRCDGSGRHQRLARPGIRGGRNRPR